jgi:hypothetical protein
MYYMRRLSVAVAVLDENYLLLGNKTEEIYVSVTKSM